MSRELAILEKLKSEYTQNNMEQVYDLAVVCTSYSSSIEDTLYGGRSKFMRLQSIYNSEKLITI